MEDVADGPCAGEETEMRSVSKVVPGWSWARHCGIAASAIVALGCGVTALAAGRQAGSSDDTSRYDVFGARAIDSNGARLFAQRCAACHEGSNAKAPHRDMLQLLSPQAIMRALDGGSMVQQAQGLSTGERADIAEFLANRRPTSAAAAASLPACQAAARRFDFDEPPPFAGWGLQPGNGHYVPPAVAGIDRGNVGSLKLEWAVRFPDATRVRSQPMPAGGALYVGSNDGTVYALDRATGCVRWSFRAAAEVRTGLVVEPWLAGDTNARPRVFFGDFLGQVYALDAQDGRLLWRLRADAHPNATITGTPTFFEGRLFVAVSSLETITAADPAYGCCRFRGSMLALDAASGRTLWRRYTIAEPAREQGRNASGTMLYGPAGAPVWNSPAVDPVRRQLYFGTGVNYASPATTTSDAVFAVSMYDGEIAWVYQGLAHDAFNSGCLVPERVNCPVEDGPDFDIGAGVVYRAEFQAGVVLAGQKSGVVHALDADDGRLLWRTRVGRGGISGGIHFGMAFGDGRLYVPVADSPDGRTYDAPARPGLFALDPVTGRELWAAPMADRCADRATCYPGISQAIAATREVVFAGGLDGWLRAYDASNGRVLWEYDTTLPVATIAGVSGHGGSMAGGSAPIPFKGMLFVSSGYLFAGGAAGDVLLAYKVSPQSNEHGPPR